MDRSTLGRVYTAVRPMSPGMARTSGAAAPMATPGIASRFTRTADTMRNATRRAKDDNGDDRPDDENEETDPAANTSDDDQPADNDDLDGDKNDDNDDEDRKRKHQT